MLDLACWISSNLEQISEQSHALQVNYGEYTMTVTIPYQFYVHFYQLSSLGKSQSMFAVSEDAENY